MNCDQFKTLWNDWYNRMLGPDYARSMDVHLKECRECRYYNRQMESMLSGLEQFPEPRTVPPDLTRQLVYLSKTKVYAVSARRRYQTVAVALLLGVIGGLLFRPAIDVLMTEKDSAAIIAATASLNELKETQTQVSLALMEAEKVHLAIDSKHAISNAIMTLELPQGIEIAGYPGQRQLSWQTDLKAGRNQLVLPLIAYQYVTGVVLKAQLDYQGGHKELEVILNVAEERAQQSVSHLRFAILTAPAVDRLIRLNRRCTV